MLSPLPPNKQTKKQPMYTKKPQTLQKTPTHGVAERRYHHKQVCHNNREENTQE